MGWIGLGVFIASASYILYKHPPRSWSYARWCGDQPAQISSTTLPEKTTENDISYAKNNGIEESLEGGASSEPNDSGTDSANTTPKATPAAPPTLNVPELSLEGSNKEPSTFSNPNANSSFRFLTAEKSQSVTMGPPPVPSKVQSEPPTPPPAPVTSTPSSTQQSRLMPPPPRPTAGSSLRPPPSAASSLRVPPTSRLSSSTLSPTPQPGKPQRSSRQVILEPGHSPLDWAALTSNPKNNLRGANLPPNLIRVTPSMLKLHNGRKGRDAWTSYMGKVYNITPFVPFHPGGKGELLRGAGKDSEKLFVEIHPWVNWDGMLSECMVGILVGENDSAAAAAGAKLDEMD